MWNHYQHFSNTVSFLEFHSFDPHSLSVYGPCASVQASEHRAQTSASNVRYGHYVNVAANHLDSSDSGKPHYLNVLASAGQD